MQINCALARHNAEEKERLYDLALALGATALHIFMLVPVGCGMEISEQNQLPAEEYGAILNWLYERSREKKLQIKATCAPHYYRIMRQRAKQEGIKLSHATHGLDAVTRGCLAGSAVCFVSHKGEVYPRGVPSRYSRERPDANFLGDMGALSHILAASRYRQSRGEMRNLRVSKRV